MKTDRRLIHASENGDRWWLRRTDDGVAVLHEPNAASGGRTSETPLGAFLREGAAGPEHRALLDLIGTLVGEAPVPAAATPEPGAAAAEPTPGEELS